MRDDFAQCVIESTSEDNESKFKDSEFAAIRCGQAIAFKTSTWILKFLSILKLIGI